ncbi:hypothetical protein CCR80_10205 [Rhodothalassium salexigens]|nr:hypothetical protein [Rhodothalassium salexigens]
MCARSWKTRPGLRRFWPWPWRGAGVYSTGMKQYLLRLGVPAVILDRVPRAPRGGLVRGIVWMVSASVCVTVMGALVKSLGQRLPPVQLAGVRAAVMVAVMALFMVPKGPELFRVRRWRLLTIRSLLLTFINGAGFWTLSVLPLFFVTAVSFTKPLFITLLAALVLGETIRLRRTLAMVAGFLGVLVTLVPHGLGLEAGQAAAAGAAGEPGGGAAAMVRLVPALVAVSIALAMAVSVVVVKRVSEVDRPTAIVFWPNLAVAVLLGSASLFIWVPPTPLEWLLIVVLAAAGWAAQQSFLRAYRCTEAGLVAPFEYVRIPLAAGVGVFVFAEIPTWWTAAGAAIIAGSTLYIARREAALGKTARARDDTDDP